MRQHSLRVALPWLMVLAVADVIGATLGGVNGLIIVNALFVGYALAARRLIASEQRYGMQYFRRKSFEQAIFHFEQSYEFFERHPWLDDWRGLILCSSSPISYREMALLNQAFCHTQIGNGARAFEIYHLCLERFPSSTMAEAALRMMEAARSGD